MQDHMETPKDHLGTIGIKINRKDKLKHSWKTFFMGNMTWNYVKETFCKKIKWNMEFDQYFWQDKTSWICRLSVVLFWCSRCAHSVFLKFFQTMEGNQKMWSNSIFHFIFLQKVSFINWSISRKNDQVALYFQYFWDWFSNKFQIRIWISNQVSSVNIEY